MGKRTGLETFTKLAKVVGVLVNPTGPRSVLDTDRVVTRLPWLLRVREGAMEVYVCWDPGWACAVRLRYVSVKGFCCWLILVRGLVPAAVCVVKLVLERSGITSLCMLRSGSWNHRAPTATSWAHGVNV